MTDLKFLEKNPVTEGYRDAEKFQLAQDTGRQLVDERTASAPYRVRSLAAGADLSETHARTARDEAPYAGPRAAAGLRGANASAKNAEMQGFYHSLDRLNAGDVEGAKEVARRYGSQLPHAIIDDAELRRAVTEAAEVSKRDYVNHPALGQQYMTGAVEEFQRKRAAGERLGPTAPYTVPNAPPAPEFKGGVNRFQAFPGEEGIDENGQPIKGLIHFDRQNNTSEFRPGPTITGRAGGGAAGTGQTERLVAALRRENPNLSLAEAIAITKRAPSGNLEQLRKETLALNAAKAEGGGVARPEMIERWRLRYGLPPAPPEPAPPSAQPSSWNPMNWFRSSTPPAPAEQRPDMMTPGDGGRPISAVQPPGQGTPDQPFMATTQEHVNFFRQNARPGDVLDVGGTLYTK